MDTLCFEKKTLRNPYSAGLLTVAVIIINGEHLLERIKEYELPYARKYNQESIAGGYEYQFAGELYKQLSDPSLRLDDNEVTLMICGGCLEEGCWPLMVTIEETDDCIIWKNFHNPHRGKESAGGFWDFSDFGSFRFDKQEYENRMMELKSF